MILRPLGCVDARSLDIVNFDLILSVDWIPILCNLTWNPELG
jgi:hypothetical protein